MKRLSSTLGLAPGLVYVAESSNRPGECKIGTSEQPLDRMRAGRTWVRSLRVVVAYPFLRRFHAESQAHCHFAERRTEGEWFRVDTAEVQAHLQDMHAREAASREELTETFKMCVELGLLATDARPHLNTAVEAILRWRLPGTRTTVRNVLSAALSGTPGVTPHVMQLAQAGFRVDLRRDIAWLRREEGSPVVAMLDRTVGVGRWEHQLEGIRGFRADGSTVTLA